MVLNKLSSLFDKGCLPFCAANASYDAQHHFHFSEADIVNYIVNNVNINNYQQTNYDLNNRKCVEHFVFQACDPLNNDKYIYIKIQSTFSGNRIRHLAITSFKPDQQTAKTRRMK